MAKVEYLKVQNLGYQKIEEFFKDKDSEIFDTILLNDTVEIAKNKLKILKDQEIDTHGVFSSYLYYFFNRSNPKLSRVCRLVRQ